MFQAQLHFLYRSMFLGIKYSNMLTYVLAYTVSQSTHWTGRVQALPLDGVFSLCRWVVLQSHQNATQIIQILKKISALFTFFSYLSLEFNVSTTLQECSHYKVAYQFSSKNLSICQFPFLYTDFSHSTPRTKPQIKFSKYFRMFE